jgi:5-hydroxyisourate hydrolase
VTFHVGEYFASHDVPTADPPYLDRVPVEVNLAADGGHYHVPLVVSPWGYTTYRGG